jgi:hypothetical protein
VFMNPCPPPMHLSLGFCAVVGSDYILKKHFLMF